MAALGSLVVQLGLNYAQFTGGLDKSEQAALQASKRVQDTFDGLKGKLAVTAGAIAGGLAAGFGIAAFKSLISSAAEAAGAVNDLASITGVSAEKLSGLAEVAKFNDVTVQTLADSMTKLARNMSSTTAEGLGAGKALQALGLNFAQFKAQSPDEQMRAVATAMNQFTDGAGKAAIAQALYGKQGATLIPVLKDLAALGDIQARITTEQAVAADNFGDNLLRVRTSGEEWRKELGLAMIPALDMALQAILNVTNGGGGLREQIRKLSADGSIAEWTRSAVTGFSYVIDAVQGVIQVVRLVGTYIGGMWAASAGFFQGAYEAASKLKTADFSGAWDTLKKGAGESKVAVLDLAGDLSDMANQKLLGQKFRESLEGLATASKDVGAEVKKNLDFQNTADEKVKAVKADTSAITDALAARLEAIRGADKLQVQSAKDAVADITAARKLGSISDIDAIDATAAAEIQSLAGTRASLVAELAVNQEKKNNLKDVAATRAKIAEQDAALAGREKQLNRDLAESYHALNDEADKRIDQSFKDTQALREQLQASQDEGVRIGLTAAAVRDLDLARADELATAKERLAFTKDSINGNTAEGDQLREQAKLIREIAGQKGSNSIAQEAQAEWKNFTDSLYNGLTDSLYRGFEAGGKFFKTFWDGLKNTIKTTVLKFGIQGVLGIAGSVGSAAAGAAGLGGGGNASSIFGAANSASSAYSLGSGAYTFGSSILGGSSVANAAGTVFANSTGTGISGLLATNGAYGTAAAGTGSAAAGTAGAAASSAASTIITVAPYLIAAAVVLNALGVFRSTKVTETGIKGTLGRDSDLESFATIRKGGTLFSGPKYSEKTSPLDAATDKAIKSAVSGMYDATGSMARALGLGTESIDAFTQSITIKLKDLKPEEVQAKIQSTLEAFQNSLADQVGGAISGFAREGETNFQTLQRLSSSLTGVNAVLDALDRALLSTSAAGGDAASQLIDVFGGLDKYQAAAGSYLQNYYSDAERGAVVTRQLGVQFEALGVAVPQTRDQFKALVDAQDLTTESGRKTYAALLGLSDAFAGVTPQIDAAALAAKRSSVQDEIDKLTGNDRAVTDRQRGIDYAAAATDPALQQLLDNLWHLQDGATAAADAVAKAAARANVQDQIDTLLGNDRAVLDRQRGIQYAAAAADPALQVLLDQLWHLQDAATDAAAATKAAADAQAAVERAQDTALASLQRAVDAQKTAVQGVADVAQQSANQLQGIFNTLKSNVADLYGQVTATQLQNAVSSRAFIAQALATAKATGYLPDGSQLTDAVAGARSGLDANNYSTKEAYDRDRLVLAGQLDTLKGLTGTQLTTAELQLQAAKDELKRLDAVLQQGRDLVDAARGIDNSVLSVTDALNRLIALVGGAKPASTSGSAGGAVIGGSSAGGSSPASGSGIGRQADGSYRFSDGYVVSTFSGSDAARIASLDAIYAKYAGTGDVAGYYRAAQAAGLSLRDVAAHDGNYYGDVLAAAAAAGVPAFALGGNHAGGARLVGERGPELEVTGPARIFNAAQTAQLLAGGGNAELVAEMRAMRIEMAALRRAATDTADSTKRMDKTLTTVTRGGDAMQTQLMPA